MINNNKILTVSYGTFSCTLEGFDDSFGTMKAIAEYFRDLASDDRYFGAEPPQPDAQMLARIAQREISRQVDAREDEGRIVLSARDIPQTAALAAAPTSQSDAAAAPVEAAQEAAPRKSAVDTNGADLDAEDNNEAQRAHDAADDILEAEDAAEATEVSGADVSSEADEEEIEDDLDLAQDLADEDTPDIVPSLPDAEVEAFFADSTATPTDAAEDMQQPAQERANADSIADKLKRIRAVVSQQGDASANPDYSEDQHAEAGVAKAAAVMAPVADEEDHEDAADAGESDVIASTLRDLEDALDADDAAEADMDLDLESEDDDIAAILNRLENEAGGSADVAYDDDLDADDDEMDENILAAMDALDDNDLDDDNLFESEDTAELASEPQISEEIEAEAAPAEAEAAPQAAPAPVTAPRTRVLKVKRATLEAAIQSGKLEEYDEDEGEAAQAAPRKAPLADRSTLSAQAEDELARELAELEADMEADDAPAPSSAGVRPARRVRVEAPQAAAEPAPVAPSARANIEGPADEDLSRLMDETDTQMEEPESATRRDAFAHLRAAVAAKKADEAVGGSTDTQETDEAYRDDLANVVRPRRPVSGERARTQRPVDPAPAPLKLVAEQRIDVAPARGATPVRPRRVATVVSKPEPIAALDEVEAESFADFASEMGAEKLPDLLEAAAAYLSFVEGHEQFSRPQLMTKVRQVEKESFTREDSLRSFGKLLREGKIEKIKGGRFQASDQIGFKPDARAAG